jgi:multidrug efflux pump subunit AcrA (membrane-fusion protein)
VTNEEFQKLVLEKLTGLGQGQAKLEQGQAKLEQRQAKLEQGQANLEQRQAKLEQGQANLEQRQAKLEQGQANLEQRQAKLEQGQRILETKVENGLSSLAARLENVEGQLSETNGIVKALIHNTEELNAKYDGLLNITASKEAVDRIEKKVDKLIEIQVVQGESINILALRQLKTESEIEALKKAR